MIDTHAHIYSAEFKSDRTQVVKRALKKGVDKILLPNISLNSIDPMLQVVAAYSEVCHPMIGLHPCYVDQNIRKSLATMYTYLCRHSFIAVGEIGIDLYRKKNYAEQEMAFITQINWAKEMNLPVVIHARNSIKEVLALLSKEQDGSLSGVFHSFVSSVIEAKEINDLGFHLGLGGISTFKNSGMDRVIPYLDLNYVVLETDCPYLAPAPHRGERNEPAYIQLIANRVAELNEIALSEVDSITTINAKRLFKI
ncbi:deoxyribonuclease YabD [Candidatus Photodesmus blepharus]|uniref:Deoxyribonuclease YabD n=1 Tax=Candidatus Photodesmus blepharonis TaxID=1179155 RepID=A0A084CNS3_9GAMM|nr:TatD family hydrolase [Candidatus Photodesmus blepharus]KEY91452.1 deoxyribonuclease YabD [Candidatus Photodesmus blepharus]